MAAYVEGVKDGKRLLGELREAVDAKPVILWRGGLTEEGLTLCFSFPHQNVSL
ncbi:hypothetical protein B6U99_03980 [Candidatus Geothermarchaeota archaeon ex4572_27]|nr:MAG: hypothetical protein B6U99_03980 [Candidatus Geothermarchaeota archaeon ex4572_27]